MERHTGKKIGPTMLRSIFVTHCERSGLSEAEKDSLAAAMSHSRRAVSSLTLTLTLVYPVGIDYNAGTRIYTLLSDPCDIHKAKHDM